MHPSPLSRINLGIFLIAYDKPGIEVSTCTRSIDQCMKPAVKMLHKKFRCQQRIIGQQETEKLPSLLVPALVVEFFLLFEIRTVRRFIGTELESIDNPIMLCEPCPTTTDLYPNMGRVPPRDAAMLFFGF